MDWDKQQPPLQPPQVDELNGCAAVGGMFVNVMTDEQMEVLRKQIAVCATICEQLVDLHKSLTSQHDLAVMVTSRIIRASKPEPVMQSEGGSKPAEPFNQMSLYGRMDQLLGKWMFQGAIIETWS